MIDFEGGREIPTTSAVEELLAWTEPARAQLGIDLGGFDPTGPNGSQRSRELLESGASIPDPSWAAVDRTADTYPVAG
jgi:hypothetical protein